MENKQLEEINKTGELTDIKLGGNTAGDSAAKLSALGNYTFDADLIQANGNTVLESDAGGVTIGEDFPNTLINTLVLSSSNADPTVPAPQAGQLYFNNNTNIARCYDGTTWNDLW